MARKLASIQKIVNIEPIEGADKIEKLTVLGWHIVASKSENHNIGDLICYIEPDSRVPEIPMFEFLKDRKYIVKTIKLRKQVSQGLVIPLRELEKNFNINISKLKEGQDVTALLGITKSGSICNFTPSPLHSSQAPYGALKLKILGSSSGREKSQ